MCTEKKTNYVIFGATSTIAENCLSIWANKGPSNFILIGRNHSNLLSVSNNLETKFNNITTSIHILNFNCVNEITKLVDTIYNEISVDVVLICHGILPDQKRCENDLNYSKESIILNAISPVIILESLVNKMIYYNYGKIGIIGSVAGDFGKKSNYVYGASKSLIEVYVQGIQHKINNFNVYITLIKPGPTETQMTSRYVNSFVKLCPVESVANDIVNSIRLKKLLVYTPRYWKYVSLLLSLIPKKFFNLLNI